MPTPSRYQVLYAARVAAHRCTKCNVPLDRGDIRVLCTDCYRKQRRYRSKKKTRTRILAGYRRRYDRGQCHDCSAPRRPDSAFCAAHKSRRNASSLAWHHTNKECG